MDGHLRDVLMAPTILGSLGATIYFFTKTITDYGLKKKMIDKGFVNEETQAIFKNPSADGKFSSLKWGLILLGAGASLVMMEYIDTRPDSPLPYGLFTLCVSAGFLFYYFLVKKELK